MLAFCRGAGSARDASLNPPLVLGRTLPIVAFRVKSLEISFIVYVAGATKLPDWLFMINMEVRFESLAAAGAAPSLRVRYGLFRVRCNMPSAFERGALVSAGHLRRVPWFK